MKSQGTFEYILLLGGVVILVLLVINQLISTAKHSSLEIKETVNIAFRMIKEKIAEYSANA